MSVQERDLLWENEVEANRILARVMIMAWVAGLIATVLILTKLLESASVPEWPYMVLIEVLLLVGPILCWRTKGEAVWLKTAMLAPLIVSCGILNGLFATSAALLMSAPVVLSIRFFSGDYTHKIAVASFVVFLVSTLWGANIPPVDLNCVQLPAGTLIACTETTWLTDLMSNVRLDESLMIQNMFFLGFLPYALVFLVVSRACVHIAARGSILIERERELTQESAAVEAELNLAARIQTGALPRTFPAFPDRHDFDVFARNVPAREVGGDFYDFFLVDDDHLCLVIADVSEKGVPAALFMMSCKTMIADRARMGKSPGRILTEVNQAVCANDDEAMFVTVWLGILDTSTGCLTAANAGHEYPFVRHAGGVWECYEDAHETFVGFSDDVDYGSCEYELALAPGASVFLYTDGLTEARNEALAMFGMDRIEEALNQSAVATPRETIENMSRAVKDFVGNAEQFDDVTMLCVSYTGSTREEAAR